MLTCPFLLRSKLPVVLAENRWVGNMEAIRDAAKSVHVPSRHDRVYNDECMFSFDTPESPGGLYTSLTTWQSFGHDYVDIDFSRNGNRLYLKQVWKRVATDPQGIAPDGASTADASPKPAIGKLGIGVDGGFDVDKKRYTSHITNSLVIFPERTSVELPNSELPTIVTSAIDAILSHDGFKRSVELVSAWEEEERKESKYAKDLPQLDNDIKISPDPKTWRCQDSGMTDNLWLNLSTGHIGSGRRNWDGSGGTGAAEKHYEDTGRKYPLVVKLGTITAEGADVFSYASDENDMVIDPYLSNHLAHWGINMQQQEKSEKTITELQIELNSNYDFSRITESGSDLVPLHGPGYVGLSNLGNSCYMSSVMQILFSISEIATRFKGNAEAIFVSAPNDPGDDLLAATAKLGVGLLSDRYTKPIPMYEENPRDSGSLVLCPNRSEEDYGSVRPFMFKNVIGKGHPEFSSGRQQDASEFLQHVLDRMNRAERIGKSRLLVEGEDESRFVPVSALFTFQVEERIQDSQTDKVKYLTRDENLLSLSIDVNDAINKQQFDDFEEQSKKRAKYDGDVEEVPVQLEVPLSACLAKFARSELVDQFTSPDTGKVGTALKRTRLKTFPEYLSVHLKRYYLDSNWTPKKLDASVPMPLELDVSHLKASGPQEDEVVMEDEDMVDEPARDPPIVPDSAIVNQLMSMGFSENGSKRAAVATNNCSAEASMEWVFQHMEDPNFNDPIEEDRMFDDTPPPQSNSSREHAPESITMLTAMGFTEIQAKAALTATNGSLERAGDWLFSHADSLDSSVREVLAEAETAGRSEGNGNEGIKYLDGDPKYELVGFASHLGSNTSSGHYVAHIRKEGQFVLFNDEKVALSQRPPIDLGFLYVYRRKKT